MHRHFETVSIIVWNDGCGTNTFERRRRRLARESERPQRESILPRVAMMTDCQSILLPRFTRTITLVDKCEKHNVINHVTHMSPRVIDYNPVLGVGKKQDASSPTGLTLENVSLVLEQLSSWRAYLCQAREKSSFLPPPSNHCVLCCSVNLARKCTRVKYGR